MATRRNVSPAAAVTAAAILRELKAHASEERRAFTEGYFPSAMRILGVPVPDLRRVAKATARAVRDWPPERVHQLVDQVIAKNTVEGRQAAYEIVAAHAGAFAALDTRRIEALGQGMDNWASVDAFATSISGRAWLSGQLTDARVHRWAKARDLWWRRAALASTVPLNIRARGGSGDGPRTLAVAERLADDQEPMVAKALSWALRCLVPWDRGAVEAFVERHDDVLAAIVKREVATKLRTGKKNPRS
ncbi:MAG: DNA alkylation repair protein [Planctomycetota bacterium]